MAEYIELEKLIHLADEDRFGFMDIEDVLKIPVADVAPVVHARWEWDTEDVYRCTGCDEKSRVKEVMGRPAWVHCPNCGARMDGGDGNEAD